mgnify:CR=1 FL=1
MNKPIRQKIKKIKPFTPHWQKLANELARESMIIVACKHCGYPVVDGSCCYTCGSFTP